MSEFWSAMMPWLIMAVGLPVAVVISLKLVPTEAWARGVIEEWADSQDLRVEAIDEPRWFDRLFISKTHVVYRVRVQDKSGRQRSCKAVVGRFVLARSYRNLRITWIKPQ